MIARDRGRKRAQRDVGASSAEGATVSPGRLREAYHLVPARVVKQRHSKVLARINHHILKPNGAHDTTLGLVVYEPIEKDVVDGLTPCVWVYVDTNAGQRAAFPVSMDELRRLIRRLVDVQLDVDAALKAANVVYDELVNVRAEIRSRLKLDQVMSPSR